MYCKNNTEVPEELTKLLESQDVSALIEDNTEQRNDNIVGVQNEIPDVSDF